MGCHLSLAFWCQRGLPDPLLRAMEFNSLLLQTGKLKPRKVMTCPRSHGQLTARARTKTRIFRVRAEITLGIVRVATSMKKL